MCGSGGISVGQRRSGPFLSLCPSPGPKTLSESSKNGACMFEGFPLGGGGQKRGVHGGLATKKPQDGVTSSAKPT